MQLQHVVRLLGFWTPQELHTTAPPPRTFSDEELLRSERWIRPPAAPERGVARVG
jgi:hypothetical protein